MHRYLTQSPHTVCRPGSNFTVTPALYRLQRAAIPMMHPSERPVAALLLRRPILVLGRQRFAPPAFVFVLSVSHFFPPPAPVRLLNMLWPRALPFLNTWLIRPDFFSFAAAIASMSNEPRRIISPCVRIRRREHLRQRQLVAMHLLHVPRALLLSLPSASMIAPKRSLATASMYEWNAGKPLRICSTIRGRGGSSRRSPLRVRSRPRGPEEKEGGREEECQEGIGRVRSYGTR